MAKQLFAVGFSLLLFLSLEVCSFQIGNRLQVVASIQPKHQHVHSINMANEAVLVSQPKPRSSSSSLMITPLRRQYRVLSVLAPICLGAFWGKHHYLKLPSLLLTAKVFDILRSAARRRRLDATTFKFLNVGTFLSLSYVATIQLMDRGAAIVFCNKEKLALIGAAMFGTLTSGAALTKYGLPSIKIQGSNLLSLSYMLCAALAVYTGVDFNSLKSIFDPIHAFMFPAVFLALSGAGIAGDKRLASDTYKGLNLTILFIMISRLGMEKGGIVSVADQHPHVHFFTALAIISCMVGFFKGKRYEKDGPSLLKAFSKD